ncbi:cell wall hydrolase [Castellaniella sp.]|uniref:cell wall hydrolase n=1 Tax=Castellaniella sp. TaxID=1955812 RepID=UPI002AFDD745|nr:cell wall hydrolase [Castellaniella sp.]
MIGQIAVANVTMNRARAARKGVCSVVMKPKQFSWTTTYVQQTALGPMIGLSKIEKEPVAWGNAVVIAQLALWGILPQRVGRATHYHEAGVSPYWASHYTVVAQVGNHIFYQ